MMRTSSPAWIVRSQMCVILSSTRVILGRWLKSGSLLKAVMCVVVLIGVTIVVGAVAADIDQVEYAPHHGGLHISEHGHRLAQQLTGNSIALDHQHHPVHPRCQD